MPAATLYPRTSRAQGDIVEMYPELSSQGTPVALLGLLPNVTIVPALGDLGTDSRNGLLGSPAGIL